MITAGKGCVLALLTVIGLILLFFFIPYIMLIIVNGLIMIGS